MIRKISILVLSLALLGAVVSGCGSDGGEATASESEDGKYVVGLTTDATGPTAGLFSDAREGLQVFFEQLNAEGGIDGHEVELVVEDNQATPENAASQARQFVSDGAQVVVLSAPSVAIQAAVPEAADAGVPILTVEVPCVRELVREQVQPNLFCFGEGEADGERVAEFIADQDPGASVAGVSYDVPTSRASIDATLNKGKELGLEAGENVVVPLDLSDPGPYAARIAKANPDYVVGYGTWEHTGGPILDELRRRGWKGTYIFPGLSRVQGYTEDLKDPDFVTYAWDTFKVDSNAATPSSTGSSRPPRSTARVTSTPARWSTAGRPA